MNIISNDSVAVIMSVYHRDKVCQLKDAVNSILNQRYEKVDLYIICDGKLSADLNNYLNNLCLDNVYITSREVNLGLAVSLNELLQIVLEKKYCYIARMDADDVSEVDRIGKQVVFLQNHPSIDLVGGAIREIDSNGNERGKIVMYPDTPEKCRKFFAKRNPVAHPTVMFRRSFFEKVGSLYPTDFIRNEDTRMWHEGFKHGCLMANLPDIVLNFRVTDDMLNKRRNGIAFAISQLKLRKLIAKDLNYGIMAYFYAYATFVLMISPSWILKLAYRFLR